ncbi:hypothetical protein HYC85_013537 [Camellia sinensis]|uniref:Dilute domain-containing protein n=1 Tax=Camellia sinensis TaxID=4442 RepID=A0A7J7H3M2_CAMSI|nr:hypothetical protein HYC85_013537 [Camellia sinensis]
MAVMVMFSTDGYAFPETFYLVYVSLDVHVGNPGEAIQAPRTSRASLVKGSSRSVATTAAQQALIAHWQGIVKSLGIFLNSLKTNHVPPFLVRKVFTQIFSFINVQLFNSLLLRRECCSFSNGEYVKAGLAELEHWCYNATDEYAGSAWDELKHIRQAIGFLVYPSFHYSRIISLQSIIPYMSSTLKEVTTQSPCEVCYRLVVFGSLVLLPRFLDLRSSEEFVARASVELCLVGRARVASLERAMASGSGPESCVSWLERAFLGSSGLVCSSLDREVCRSSVLVVTDLRVRVVGSSEHSFARAHF